MAQSLFAYRLTPLHALPARIGIPTELAAAKAQAPDSQAATKTFLQRINLSLGVFGQLTPARTPASSIQGLDPQGAWSSDPAIQISRLFTVANEPTASVMYTFGARRSASL